MKSTHSRSYTPVPLNPTDVRCYAADKSGTTSAAGAKGVQGISPNIARQTFRGMGLPFGTLLQARTEVGALQRPRTGRASMLLNINAPVALLLQVQWEAGVYAQKRPPQILQPQPWTLKECQCCAAGEIGGGSAAESKGEQANALQRAAGEATGRDGAQIPDKMQDIGQASGAHSCLALSVLLALHTGYPHPLHLCEILVGPKSCAPIHHVNTDLLYVVFLAGSPK